MGKEGLSAEVISAKTALQNFLNPIKLQKVVRRILPESRLAALRGIKANFDVFYGAAGKEGILELFTETLKTVHSDGRAIFPEDVDFLFDCAFLEVKDGKVLAEFFPGEGEGDKKFNTSSLLQDGFARIYNDRMPKTVRTGEFVNVRFQQRISEVIDTAWHGKAASAPRVVVDPVLPEIPIQPAPNLPDNLPPAAKEVSEPKEAKPEVLLLNPEQLRLIRAVSSEPTLAIMWLLTEIQSLSSQEVSRFLNSIIEFKGASPTDILDQALENRVGGVPGYSRGTARDYVQRMSSLSGILISKVFKEKGRETTRYKIPSRHVEFARAVVGHLGLHLMLTGRSFIDYFPNPSLNLNEKDAVVNRVNLFRVLTTLRSRFKGGPNFEISLTELAGMLDINSGTLLNNHINPLKEAGVISYESTQLMYARSKDSQAVYGAKTPVIDAIQSLEQETGRTQFSYAEIKAKIAQIQKDDVNDNTLRSLLSRMESKELQKQEAKARVFLTTAQQKSLLQLVRIIEHTIVPNAQFIAQGNNYLPRVTGFLHSLLIRAKNKSPYLKSGQQAVPAAGEEIIPPLAIAVPEYPEVKELTEESMPVVEVMQPEPVFLPPTKAAEIQSQFPDDPTINLIQQVSGNERATEELASILENPSSRKREAGESPTYIFEYTGSSGQRLLVKWVKFDKRSGELNEDAQIAVFAYVSGSSEPLPILTFYPESTSILDIDGPSQLLTPREYRTLNAALSDALES